MANQAGPSPAIGVTPPVQHRKTFVHGAYLPPVPTTGQLWPRHK